MPMQRCTARYEGRTSSLRRSAWILAGSMLLCAVGLVEAAAPSGVVHYVDSTRGDDENPGSRQQPWKTLVRAVTDPLAPGDTVLLRRGCAWDGESLVIRGVRGTDEQPITFGAYGPPGEPRPSIGNGRVSVRDCEHLVIRDLEVHHSPGGPCIAVSESGYLTVMNNLVHHARSNGIAYHERVHHTATIGNTVYDVLANDGISIHDGNWGRTPTPVGSHHWVIDNLMTGNYREDAIDFASEDYDNAKAAEDVKIIGNRIVGARLAGVVAQHQCRYVWVLGNTIARCGTSGAAAISLGKEKGDGLVKASGNLLVGCPRSVRLRDRAEFCSNTVVHGGAQPAILLAANAQNMLLGRNLVLTNGAPWVRVEDGLPTSIASTLDWNWYDDQSDSGAARERAFQYQGGHTPSEWQARLGQDRHSVFGPGPRLHDAGTLPTDVTTWDDAVFARFAPDKSWRGHNLDGRQVGALASDGKRQGVEIVPFADYHENGGYGWPGPQIVQERYPLPQ